MTGPEAGDHRLCRTYHPHFVRDPHPLPARGAGTPDLRAPAGHGQSVTVICGGTERLNRRRFNRPRLQLWFEPNLHRSPEACLNLSPDRAVSGLFRRSNMREDGKRGLRATK